MRVMKMMNKDWREKQSPSRYKIFENLFGQCYGVKRFLSGSRNGLQDSSKTPPRRLSRVSFIFCKHLGRRDQIWKITTNDNGVQVVLTARDPGSLSSTPLFGQVHFIWLTRMFALTHLCLLPNVEVQFHLSDHISYLLTLFLAKRR